MKSNKLNYVSKFKYLMLIPIVLLVLAVIVGAIWGLNLDYDFKTVSNFTVKFNTTVSETEYDTLQDELKSIIKTEDFDNFRLERVGEGAQNGIIVKVPNENFELDEKLESLRTTIESKLLADINIESSVVVTTSELSYFLPKNVTSILWYSLLAIACIIIFLIAYKWIRYNLMSGLALATSIAIEIVMLFSSMILFRIPFNYYFVIPFVVMILTTIINVTIMNNYIKTNLSNENYSKKLGEEISEDSSKKLVAKLEKISLKTSNALRVEDTTRKYMMPIIMYSTMIIAIVLGVMFFGGASLIFLGLGIIVGVLISVFVSLFINTSLWSFWYNKTSDNTLKRRIQREKEKEDIKSGKIKDDKLVV